MMQQKMAFSHVIKICAYVMLICAMTTAAPIVDQVSEDEASAAVPEISKIPQEENDLHELLNLVDNEAHQDNVLVRQEHVAHVTNHNGKTTKVEQKEEKVVDAKSGDVIADVKQETKEQTPKQGQEPETVVKTEVQLPANGLDETYIQESPDASSSDEDSVENTSDEAGEEEDDMEDLTAEDMAEFLLATQQVESFFPALQRLVNQSKMTAAEAQAYARRVMADIDRIQMMDLAARANEQKRDYMQYMGGQPLSANDLMDPAYLPSPSLDAVPQDAVYMTPLDTYKAQSLLRQQQQFVPDFLRDDPVKFLFSLFDAAYEKGDPGAQDVINMLYERISQSEDPGDMALIQNLEKHYNDLYRPLETYVEVPEDLWNSPEVNYVQGLLPVAADDTDIESDEVAEEDGDKPAVTENEEAESQEGTQKAEEDVKEATKEREEIEEELENVLQNEDASNTSGTANEQH